MKFRYFAGLALVLVPGLAAAQSPRTFVSGNGADTNPCTVAAPCRSFVQALAQTNSGGEILVLDSAGYGTLTIDRSVSIVAPAGVYGGVTVPSGGTGITINGDYAIVLRGLTINGNGVGATGVSVMGGGKVEVHDCVVRGMTQNGISFGNGGTLLITRTTVSQNGAAAVYMRASSTGVSNGLSMSNVTLANSDKGFQLSSASDGSGYATLDSSIVSGNKTGLFLSTDNRAGGGSLFSSSNALQNNTMSYSVGFGASLSLEKTSLRSRGPLASVNDGKIYSFGDNAFGDGTQGNAFVSLPLR